MSTALHQRDQIILAKIETTEGTDASPVVGSNAILCAEATWNPLAGESVALDYIRNYFGNSESIRTKDWAEMSVTVDVSGSGTAATAPAYGPLLRGCGMAETTTAAPVTGTAQAGSATSVTLAAGASATTDLYAGMPISITVGTGSGSVGMITAYDGTTKVATIVPIGGTWTAPDATSTYSIGANVMYSPITTGQESLTIYRYVSGVLHKMFAAKANVNWTMQANGRPALKFDFLGTYQQLTDASPGGSAVLSAFKAPIPINSANSQVHFAGLKGDGTATGIQVSGLTLNLGNQVSSRNLIGFDGIVLSDRKSTGQITFDATAVAVKNWPEYIRTVSTDPLVMRHGMSAGASTAITAVRAQLTSLSEGNDVGIVTYQGQLSLLPRNGNDELRFCTF